MPKKFLLHSCCAPCLTSVYEKLSPLYDITVFWYNPNIWPQTEHNKRLKTLGDYCKKIGANLREEEYNNKEKELKTILKIAYLAPVWEVQEMKVLPIKKMDNSKQFNEAVESVNEEKKDDLPF